MSLFPEKEAEQRDESKQLAESELQPGETLLYSDKNWPMGCLGIAVLSPVILIGLFFAYVAIDTLSESVGFSIFFIILAILFIAPVYYMTFQEPKNYCFITDKRVCVREVNFFGKWKNRDIPLDMIEKTFMVGTRRRSRPTLYAVTKNGEKVKITKIHPYQMREALEGALKQISD